MVEVLTEALVREIGVCASHCRVPPGGHRLAATSLPHLVVEWENTARSLCQSHEVLRSQLAAKAAGCEWSAALKLAAHVLFEITDNWACDLDGWDLLEHATELGLFKVRTIADAEEAERLGIAEWEPDRPCHVLTPLGLKVRAFAERRRTACPPQSQALTACPKCGVTHAPGTPCLPIGVATSLADRVRERLANQRPGAFAEAIAGLRTLFADVDWSQIPKALGGDAPCLSVSVVRDDGTTCPPEPPRRDDPDFDREVQSLLAPNCASCAVLRAAREFMGANPRLEPVEGLGMHTMLTNAERRDSPELAALRRAVEQAKKGVTP